MWPCGVCGTSSWWGQSLISPHIWVRHLQGRGEEGNRCGGTSGSYQSLAALDKYYMDNLWSVIKTRDGSCYETGRHHTTLWREKARIYCNNKSLETYSRVALIIISIFKSKKGKKLFLVPPPRFGSVGSRRTEMMKENCKYFFHVAQWNMTLGSFVPPQCSPALRDDGSVVSELWCWMMADGDAGQLWSWWLLTASDKSPHKSRELLLGHLSLRCLPGLMAQGVCDQLSPPPLPPSAPGDEANRSDTAYISHRTPLWLCLSSFSPSQFQPFLHSASANNSRV